jgi:PAS domain S-box-containing protein
VGSPKGRTALMPERLFGPFERKRAERFNANRMMEEVRHFDWTNSSLGDIANWPEAVKHAARTMLLSPTAMTLLIGSDGLVLHNDAARRMFGAAFESALGRPIGCIFPELKPALHDAIDRCLEGYGLRAPDQPVRLLRNGLDMTAWFDFAFTPIADEHGVSFGALVTSHENTRRVKALRALQRSRERLDMTLHHGGIVGTWEVDFRSDMVTCDSRFARLHGVDPQSAATGVDKAQFIAGIHPDDRDAVMGAFDRAKAARTEYRLQHRVIGSGETRWIVASGRMFEDEAGTLSHFLGVIVDVTDQVQVTLALAESERLLKALADTVPQVVFSASADGLSDYMNRRWYEFTGAPEGPFNEAIWQSFVHPDDRETLLACWRRSLETGERYDIEYRCRHHSGDYRWVHAMAMPFKDSDGRIVRWFGTNTDIHDARQVAAERELVAGELDHRIKNLFALFAALIRLSTRDTPETAAFGESLQLRLEALHQAHDLIRENDSPGQTSPTFSLQLLVAKLLKPYASADSAVVIEGSDVELDTALATPLALVFHELATNAAKYGALSIHGGALRIAIEPVGSAMRIRWIETGPTPKAPPSDRVGFGSNLLKLSVERQLKGTISSQFTPSGFEVELTIPIAGGGASPPSAT